MSSLVEGFLRSLWLRYSYGKSLGGFQGVYRDFAHARTAAGGEKRGLNRVELVAEYGRKLDSNMQSFEYPALYWLYRLLEADSNVLDFGGSLGIHYRRYSPHLAKKIRNWTVCEVPLVVEAGRMLNIPSLEFTEEVELAGVVDVLFSSGTLQYVDIELSDLLGRLLQRPRYLILNRLPLHPSRACVTLQFLHGCYYPHRTFIRQDFLEQVKRAGYVVRDEWQNDSDCCRIPFHPEFDVLHYSGFCCESL